MKDSELNKLPISSIRPLKSGKKSRSRNGCHNCKRLKIKCDELKPKCKNCIRTNNDCDYRLKLCWDGRPTIGTSRAKNPFSASNISISGSSNIKIRHVSTQSSARKVVNLPLTQANDSTSLQTSIEPSQITKDQLLGVYEGDALQIQKSKESDLVGDWYNQKQPSIFKSDSDAGSATLTAEPVTDEFLDTSISLSDNFYNSHITYLFTTPMRNGISDSCLAWDNSVEGETSADTETVPRALEPLPDILMKVPLYRQYFHHFVNVTANVLVPVPKIYENNPFRKLLPRMAMNTPHLLTLLIAYGACHYSQYIGISPPEGVLKTLMTHTFQLLSSSLENEEEAWSDTTLTGTIMLTGYEIVSRSVEDSWRFHLHGAREIVQARGLASKMLGGILSPARSFEEKSANGDNLVNPSINRFSQKNIPYIGPQPLRVFDPSIDDKESIAFVLRMFAYIDMLSGFTSGHVNADFDGGLSVVNDELSSNLWSLVDSQVDKEDSSELGTSENIDYLLGVDLNTIPLFYKVTTLAKKRRELPLGSDTEKEAFLIADGMELASLLEAGCKYGELRREARIHNLSIEEHKRAYYYQLSAMNSCFGYGALVYLYRQVLRFPSHSQVVQDVVNRVTEILERYIPSGSDVEACMCFPVFMIGCEVIDPTVRESYWERFTLMDRFGQGQFKRARELMLMSWKTGRDWTDLIKELGWSLVLT